MLITQKYIDDLTYKIVGCAIEVHRYLGPGLLESVYEKCFLRELSLKNLNYQQQRWVRMDYKGDIFDAELRYDVLIEDLILVELKSVECLAPIFDSVLLSYMKLMKKPKGILINFNSVNIYKDGRKTFVNEYYAALPKS
jgi:GxxExxY protein